MRARSSEGIRVFGVGFNTSSGEPSTSRGPYPYQFATQGTAAVNDDTVQAYLLRAPQGTWNRLGLWVAADEPATFEALSVSVIPTEAAYAGAPVGLRTTAENQLFAAYTGVPVGRQTADEDREPALYVRAPGRVEYDVRVPEAGRLEVALGVLRDDVPVTFRVKVVAQDGTSVTLLEESWRIQRRWAQRSLDLSPWAGRVVRLALEAEAERPGTVALWGSPTLYEPGELSVSILDEASGTLTPARVRLTDANGDRTPFPQDAISLMYGRNDRAESYDYLPNGDFYADGAFEVQLQPGTYHLSLSKGYEYLEQEHELVVEAGEELSRTFRLERWIDMPARGWFPADDHIHIRRSPREDPLILAWVAAEDIHVGALLQMGDFWATYFAQYAWGRDGVYQLEDYLLTSGQEDPRTHELGHTISLAADDFVRFSGEYYYYDRIFDRVRELGGVTGYAHQGVTFHGYRG